MTQLFQQLLESPSFPSESGSTFPAQAGVLPLFLAPRKFQLTGGSVLLPSTPHDPRKFFMEFLSSQPGSLELPLLKARQDSGSLEKRDEQSQKGSV